MTAGFYLNVAASRRGAEVRRLKRHLEILDREQKANQFVQTDYAKLRLKQIADDREATEAQIAELEGLSDEELIQRFNPPVERPEGMSTAELAGRGAHVPSQVVVSRTPLPVRRYGGPPSPAPSA